MWHRILLVCIACEYFSVLIESTMKTKLKDDWQQSITSYVAVMDQLGLKTTLKMHFITNHATKFLQQHADGSSFAAFSEQAMEHCHYKFRQWRDNFNVPHNFQKIDVVSNNSILKAVAAFSASSLPTGPLLKLWQSGGRGGDTPAARLADKDISHNTQWIVSNVFLH